MAEKTQATNYKSNNLTDLEYKVTQESWTERPFDNKYWDNKREWIYVDIIDWTPLFSSTNKYDSGTGWPSFTKPISLDNLEEVEDNKLFTKRIEIIWAKSKSHIGHLFNDWPKDQWWLRYCMNSASLMFISKEDLEQEWYGVYLSLFE